MDKICEFIHCKMLEAKLVAYSHQNNSDGAPEPLLLINLTHFSYQTTHHLVQFWFKNAHVASLPLLKNVVNNSIGRLRGAAPCLEVFSSKLEPNPHAEPPLINYLVQNLTNISGSTMIIEEDEQIFGPCGAIYASVQKIPHLPIPKEVDNATHVHTREFLSATNQNGISDEGSTLAPSSTS
ncbi:hypothetical protein VP01_4697g1 [Puccinia sorghi]|uniref:Uncharacterized protein n=1 Tax=Puccinia sorghi TaxID=27349 RepID=A0A0L6UN22_9BASI|nr:hypothetical protein VP01_4697g1 [Puccinia sorghi]